MISLSSHQRHLYGRIALPSSKSESNRALIIQALAGKGIELSNLAIARDTQTMMRLLASEDEELNVLDAGTTMRFLTAYCVATNRPTLLTGTHRMLERPIGILVEALRTLGAHITYEAAEGFPPIRIHGFAQQKARIAVRGDVSSQYISALLMIGPVLPQGLELELLGEIGSRPYIDMTLQIMRLFGVNAQWDDNLIRVPRQSYKHGKYAIESDWSGASYWYSMAALAPEAELHLLGLREKSWQGDISIVQIMNQLGVHSSFTGEGMKIYKGNAVARFKHDFTHCPDLAQTVAVVCAAKGIKAELTGLQSLRIKETDRIAALQQELRKFGAKTEALGDDALVIDPADFDVKRNLVTVETYKDHRMAMAFAPLALLGNINIEDPKVVEKSYPNFWEHLEAKGFLIENLEGYI